MPRRCHDMMPAKALMPDIYAAFAMILPEAPSAAAAMPISPCLRCLLMPLISSMRHYFRLFSATIFRLRRLPLAARHFSPVQLLAAAFVAAMRHAADAACLFAMPLRRFLLPITPRCIPLRAAYDDIMICRERSAFYAARFHACCLSYVATPLRRFSPRLR